MESSVYNKYGLIAVLAAVAFSVLFIGKLLLFDRRIDLGETTDDAPEGAEAEVAASDAAAGGAEGAQQQAATAEEPPPAEPWIASERLIAQGETLYQTHCAVCHGSKGKGDGTPGLEPPPRNLVQGEWKRGGSAQSLFITLQEGFEGTSMISYKHLSVTDRWALVHYIQSITKNKVTDDPESLEAFGKTAE